MEKELLNNYYSCLHCEWHGIRAAKGVCPSGCHRLPFREANERIFRAGENPDPSTLRSGND